MFDKSDDSVLAPVSWVESDVVEEKEAFTEFEAAFALEFRQGKDSKYFFASVVIQSAGSNSFSPGSWCRASAASPR